MQGAWKVGLFLVLFAVMVLTAYKILGKSIFAPETVSYTADFDDAGGVTAGAKVVMAGVQIGSVTGVELAGPRSAILNLEILKSVKIPYGSVAVMETALIGIGDRAIEIDPPREFGLRYMEPGERFIGRKKSALQSILPESDAVLGKVNDTLKAVTKVLDDKEIRKSVSGAVQDTQKLIAKATQMIENFSGAAKRVDTILAANQTNARRALENGIAILDDVKKVSSELAKLAQSGKLEGQVDRLVASMDKTIASANGLVEDMRAMVNDPRLRDPVNEILANTKTMSESGTRIASNAEDISKNGVVLSERAIEIAEKASKLADDARALLDSFKKTIDKLPEAPRVTNSITARLDVTRETDPNYYRTDFNVTVPSQGRNVHAGLWDAFETNKVNLQLGHPVGNDGEVRYGMYAGKPGLGVDYRLGPNVSVRGDVFGFNKPRFDVRARFDFGKEWTAWLGLDRVFERNAPSIGVGIRR